MYVAQVWRRIAEIHGEREVVKNGVNAVLGLQADWGRGKG